MDIGARPVNPTIMCGIADQHRGDAGGSGSVHVERRVAEIPDRTVRRPADPVQREPDWRRVGLVGRGVAGADDRAEMGHPAKMLNLGAEVAAGLVGHHALRPGRARGQRVGGAWHRRDVAEVLVLERGVEDVASAFPLVAEHGGKTVAQGDADAGAGVGDGPQGHGERGERGVERGGDAGPAVHQRIIPVVEENGGAGGRSRHQADKRAGLSLGVLRLPATRGAEWRTGTRFTGDGAGEGMSGESRGLVHWRKGRLHSLRRRGVRCSNAQVVRSPGQRRSGRVTMSLAPRLLRVSIASALAIEAAVLANAQTPQVEKNISMRMALMILEGASEQCTKDGNKVSVVVVDRAGNVAASIRGDGSNPDTMEFARLKAYTARTRGQSTSEFKTFTDKPENAFLKQILGVVAVGGGVPIKAGNEVIGGVGVSGSPGGDKDETCANAGIAKIAPSLQ